MSQSSPRVMSDWKHIMSAERWLEIANSRDSDMSAKGYERCAALSKAWRKSKEGKQQSKRRRSLLGGKPGAKPWIYPMSCYVPKQLE